MRAAEEIAEEIAAGLGVDGPSACVFDQLRCAGPVEVSGLPEPQDQG